jgi:hypothetical protein
MGRNGAKKVWMSIEPFQRLEKRGNSGSFAYRKHAIWHVRRKLGEAVFQCRATSKRSRVRCKFSAIKGSSGLCYWHGGTGGDNRKPSTPPVSLRHLSNRTIKKSRGYADKELERRRGANELHEGTAALFRDTCRAYRDRLHPADEGRLFVAVDDHLKNEKLNAPGAWRELLRSLGLVQARPTSASKSIEPKPVEPREFEYEATIVDRRIAARPASSREPIETIELWRSPKDTDRRGW